MKSTATHDFLQLNPAAGEPYYRQIYTRLRSAMADGLLEPGDRIPSARALAAELGLARGTVESAYSLLAAEGYIEARGQAGTVVASGLKALPVTAGAAPALPASIAPDDSAPAVRGTAPAPALRPFQMGVPALDAFPRKIWARLAARAVRATQPADMLYPPPAGLDALRVEIARYLQLSRGIVCSPAQVFVTAGYRDSLDLAARALLQPGDQVWVEDPGYPPAGALLREAGMTLAGIPVDHEGLQVRSGLERAPRARAAVVTPAHHSPLCVTLSLQRRIELLDWASRHQAWIVEDDYDGEYRYVSRPLPALKSLDRDDRVLYAGTFSKVLFPAIRLAYLVAPVSQAARFEQTARCFSGGSPALTQGIVAAFMAEGHFARHIQRMRRLYSERRELAAAGLDAVLGKYMQVEAQPGGMHLLLRLRGRRSDRALAERMRADGMFSRALSECVLETRPGLPPMLMLSFTNIASQRQAQHLAKRILALL
ncbi:PLP-dependent aminotransferase family protein [Herbaspirillum sp. SJZ099]|uniref:MocR-like pyridoxine biosynthesis transcription factor PdxR n=1 Tax=Herbaspirillum sp. SJZ099 TaxID=2572916 RepID=UPI0011A372BC|nr:PLP-dependent aminotransferase family protein [Herbaspirillum sp. SJZ099]TWC64521.1 GntR family transcriptional regulator/MocR family aminotransferase [Herbaspirillum sp. SJZ099]